jgi:hypothetical protein
MFSILNEIKINSPKRFVIPDAQRLSSLLTFPSERPVSLQRVLVLLLAFISLLPSLDIYLLETVLQET